jgi:hypothetical protein
MTDELEITEDDVRLEHLEDVNQWAHWAYLFGVLGAGTLAMVLLIAFLGGT